MLTIDNNHVYRHDGDIIPGVTNILPGWIKTEYRGEEIYVHASTGFVMPVDKMNELADIGTGIHKGMFYLLTGKGLNWDRLNPVLVGPLRQGERWIAENKPEIIMCEKPLYSKRYRYAGTEDLFCVLKNAKKGRRTLIDFKSGMFDAAGPQTAAYENLIREEMGYRGFIDRFVLSLPKDGSDYKVIPLTDKTDFQYFLHCLAIYNINQGRNNHGSNGKG